MEKLPSDIRRVKPENKCDVCKDTLAGYYSPSWYIHICSVECFTTFLKGYYKEIDAIAIEIKKAADLGEQEDIEE